MLDEEKEIKEEVKEPDLDAMLEAEVAGETQTPNEVPNVNTEPVATEEQKAEADLTEDNPDGTPTPNPQVAQDTQTHPASVDGQSGVPNEGNANVDEQIEKMLSQSQVNELIGNTRTETRDKTRAEVMNEIYGRYGVSSDDELNDIFGRGQNYDILNDNYAVQSSQLREVMAENALLKTGISESRWGDAKAILASKGLEVNQDNIMAELVTHPEWKAVPSMESGTPHNTQPLTPQGAEQIVQNTRGPMTPHNGEPSVIRRLGENGESVPSAEAEDAKMKRLFNL